MPDLFTYFRSSASFRVRIALNLKGISYEPKFVSLPSAEHREKAFLDKNPQGLLPYLDDGDVGLSQSLAIIDYLDQKHPNPPLYPERPGAAATVRSMAMTIAADIHPLNNLRVLKYLKEKLGCDQDAVNQWYRHWVSLGFEALEQQLKQHRSDQFCFGNSVTVADVCLVPQVWNARRFETDLSAFPRITKIDAALREIAAFEIAAPENQPDAF